MISRHSLASLLFVVVVAGCAAAPAAPTQVPQAPAAPPAALAAAPTLTRMIESPPIEPVEAPAAQAGILQASPPEATTPTQPVAVVPPPETPAPVQLPPLPVAAEPTPEEREFASLLADLQRYGALGADDVRREQQAQSQALQRTRSDTTRVRLAVLYTLSRTPADDQRALQQFETVAKSNPGSGTLKQLAAVLSAQVAERVRAVRDEQARSEAALQKLEALRAMERSLLRDRVRSGGGGGGAGSGGN